MLLLGIFKYQTKEKKIYMKNGSKASDLGPTVFFHTPRPLYQSWFQPKSYVLKINRIKMFAFFQVDYYYDTLTDILTFNIVIKKIAS